LAKKFGFRRSAPRAKRATPAQIAASEKAWSEADGSFAGLAAKGDVVVDYTGQCFKVTRGGRRYHEDASSLLYPVKACRAPKDFATCERLRTIIEDVLRTGTQDVAEPKTAADAKWQDAKVNNYAILPRLEVYGQTVRAVRYVYDYGNIVAEVTDARLAREARKLIAAAPKAPVHLQHVSVRLRGLAAAARGLGEGLAFLARRPESKTAG